MKWKSSKIELKIEFKRQTMKILLAIDYFNVSMMVVWEYVMERLESSFKEQSRDEFGVLPNMQYG